MSVFKDKVTKEQYEQFFRDADTSGDGTLTFGELTKVLSASGYDAETIEKYCRAADCQEGDHKITLQEFLIAMDAAGTEEEHQRARIIRTFNGFDTDGSGHMDKAELKECMSFMDADEIDRLYGMCDTDGDGKVTLAEFTKQTFLH